MVGAFGKFCVVALGSVIVGTLCGVCSAFIFKKFKFRLFPSLEISLVFIFAYLPYLLSEGLGLSGIMAILFCGITMAHYTHTNLSLVTQITTQQSFRMFAFLSETFVFAYLGLAVFSFNHKWHIGLIAVSIFLCLFGRALNIYPLTYFVNKFRKVEIDSKMQFIMFFSGLRGAIAFALALNVPSSHSNLMVTTTLAVVLFTIVVFGGGTLPLISLLGVQKDAMSLSDKVHMSKTAVLGHAMSTNQVNNETRSQIADTQYSWFERMDNDYFRPWLCISEQQHAEEDLFKEHEGGSHSHDPLTTLAARELVAMDGSDRDGVQFHRVGSKASHVVDGSSDIMEGGQGREVDDECHRSE